LILGKASAFNRFLGVNPAPVDPQRYVEGEIGAKV